MVDFKGSFNYPKKDIWAYGLGVAFILIPFFFILGYCTRIMEDVMKGNNTPPEWKNLGDILIKGEQVLGILTAYTIIPIIIMLLGDANMVSAILKGNASPWSSESLTFIIGLLLLFISFGIVPMAIANFVGERQLRAGFEIREIFTYILREIEDYLLSYIVLLGITLFALVTLRQIPVVGIIILLPVVFYILMVSGKIFADIYNTARA